jgi:hypothetical protein
LASQHTPRVDGQVPVHIAKFSTFTSAIDLRAQSGYPTHCPERILLHNATSGALNASIVDLAGHTTIVSVGALEKIYIDAAIASIAAATDDTLTAIYAFWWVDGSTTVNA